jgi:prepilin-type cleavage/methylation N-terminal domain protein
MRKSRAERGDTLVEVTVAMAVLGLMLAASLAIINRSLMGVSNAVERTSIRASLNTEVELLRYIFDDQVTNKKLVDDIVSKTQPDQKVESRGCEIGTNSFTLYDTGNQAVPVAKNELTPDDKVAEHVGGKPGISQQQGQHNGIWIEGYKRPGGAGNSMPGYIDFYVRACWTPYAAQQLGSGRMEANVRVYYKGN